MWVYQVLVPSFALPGWLPTGFIEQGPFGIELLRPYALLGLNGLDSLSHALFWSMLANVGGYVIVSLLSHQGALEIGRESCRESVCQYVEISVGRLLLKKQYDSYV